MPIDEESNDPNVPAVVGRDTGEGGFGVQGISTSGHGIHGDSKTSRGVVGMSEGFHGVFGHSITNVGVAGETESMSGVLGVSKGAGGVGVQGEDRGGGGIGVHGFSTSGRGVQGESTGSRGVFGKSDSNDGVHGESNTGNGVFGFGIRGVVGESPTFQGVFGHSTENAGVVGESETFHAVFGISHDVNNAGVFGTNNKGGFGVIGVSEQGIGISGKGGRLAGRFEGNVEVTGNLIVDGDVSAKLIPRMGIAVVNSSQGSTQISGPVAAVPLTLTLSENGHYVVFARVVIQNDDSDPQNVSASITDNSDPPSVFDRLDVRVPGKSPSAFSLQGTLVFSDAHEGEMRLTLRCKTFNGTALQPSIFAVQVSDFKFNTG
jgi:hypothetical protein